MGRPSKIPTFVLFSSFLERRHQVMQHSFFKRVTVGNVSNNYKVLQSLTNSQSIKRDLIVPKCSSFSRSKSKLISTSSRCGSDHLNKSSSMALPKLVVFDLDYTLWPFWVDTHVDPPFKMGSNGKVYDAHQQHVKYYSDVPDILSRLHREGYYLGIASRTSLPVAASDLTRLFNWDQYFHYRQIYPGCKITHFKKLHEQSGIPYEDMIFFDDEHRNIHDVSSLESSGAKAKLTKIKKGKLLSSSCSLHLVKDDLTSMGVTCILVPDGVNNDSFEKGMLVFRERKASKAKQSKS